MLSNKRGSQPAERPLASDEELRKIRVAFFAVRRDYADLKFRRYELNSRGPRVVLVEMRYMGPHHYHINRRRWLTRRERGKAATTLDRPARAKLVDLEHSSVEAAPLLRV